MIFLLLGLVLFLGAHSISIANEPWRNRMVARLGENPWKGIYAVVSLVGFALIIWGYGLARQNPVVLYVPPSWFSHIAMVLMVFVFPLLLAAYLPGKIKSATKHPMLLATKIWALAHLLTNGALADVILFGSFLAWAVTDRISMKRRIQRPIPTVPVTKFNDTVVVVLGLASYAAFALWGHKWLIGVAPMGR